ncbi:nickel insertion protein [Streptomyces massasporeus]|uniref:nickel insertion protein n=1 Tax=Streptomyces massasporeus TaxID=67324 RepID=UPI0033AEA31C
MAETGSLGVRRVTATRTTLPRGFDGHSVRIKHGTHSAKPWHDDVVAAATELALPWRAVAARALRLRLTGDRRPQRQQDCGAAQ